MEERTGGTGTFEMILKDGKPAGWTASGNGSIITLATGAAADTLGHQIVCQAKSTVA
jgi:hypothetical protein